jgi:hypothetical protein
LHLSSFSHSPPLLRIFVPKTYRVPPLFTDSQFSCANDGSLPSLHNSSFCLVILIFGFAVMPSTARVDPECNCIFRLCSLLSNKYHVAVHSVPDDSEPIPHKREYGFIEDFCICLWPLVHSDKSHRPAVFESLRGLKLLIDISDIWRLPMAIRLLKKSITAQLPLLRQKRLQVAVTPEKLPTHALEKNSTA